jgi:hypothetical protein
MALGKESMAGHWCMQCKASQHQFSDDCKLWTMDELVRCGEDAETRQGDPLLGVKKKPWWPFLPLGNYMVPLLHCLIGIGNQLLEKLRAIIHEYIASYSPGEGAIRDSVPALQNRIADTAKRRDEWDESAEGGKRKGRLMQAVVALFVLRDGAFSLARTVNPMENDTMTYLRYVVVAVHGHKGLSCTITPKVHLMLKPVAWQMRHIPGGWGKKWKIGLSEGIKPGCICESASALFRTRSSVRWRGRRQIPVHHIPM